MACDPVALSDLAIGSDSTQDGVDTVLDGINGVVGAVANWVGLATTLIQSLQNALSHAPDPGTLLSELEQNVETLLQSVQGLISETKMLSLAAMVNQARDRLNTLMIEGVKGKDVNEPLFFSQAQDAAYTIADNTYWIRPYLADLTLFSQSIVSDSYFPNSGLPATVNYEGSTFVYDPQLPLPAFSAAISIFTSVAAIFHVNDPQTIQPYFTDLATFLQDTYQTLTQGLVTVPVPSINLMVAMAKDFLAGEIQVRDGESLAYGILGLPGLWHGEIGAVDIYGVFGSAGYASPLPSVSLYLASTTNAGAMIGVYPTMGTLMTQFLGPLGLNQIPYAYPWFYVRMRIGSLARFKALYLTKGYDQIWNLIQKLRTLSAGKSGTPALGLPPTPAAEATDSNAHWRLSQIDSIFGELQESYENWPSSYHNPSGLQLVSAEEVIQRLLGVIDNSTNNPTEEPPSLAATQPRPLSLRKAIIAAAF